MSRQHQFPFLWSTGRQRNLFRFKDQLQRDRTSVAPAERTVARCKRGDLHWPIRLFHLHFQRSGVGNEAIESVAAYFQSFETAVAARNREPESANSQWLRRRQRFHTPQCIAP